MEKLRFCVCFRRSLSKISRPNNHFKSSQRSFWNASLLSNRFFSPFTSLSFNVFHEGSEADMKENGRFHCSQSHKEKEKERSSLDLMKSIVKCQRGETFSTTIPVKAYFLCTCVNLKSIQTENEINVIPPNSRSSNYVTLQYPHLSPRYSNANDQDVGDQYSYMIVFQYGSVVLFNVEDVNTKIYLDIVRKHATGLIFDVKKDDYTVQENPLLVSWMQVGLDYIILRKLDPDGMRIIASVLGQSVALDHFVQQVDNIVEEFTDINRGMETHGTFKMEREKLFHLVGRANTNLSDVIMKLGLFERSEIAWRDGNYAQILEHLRDEYELTQRFGNLDFKLKFVEHNIQFHQKVLRNKRTDFSEWCIIFLLTVENIIEIYMIIKESAIVPS